MVSCKKNDMKKIAVVGTGIAGLASAWILSQKYEVTLYEKNDYVGGHTNTRAATFGDKTVYADTGFMVFNNKTYPHLMKMFEYLDIQSVKTDMAFGITVGGGQFEFSSDNVFVQPLNFFRPKYWKMLSDIVRFNHHAVDVVEKHSHEFPLKELMKELSLGTMFQEKYLLPMAGAIWSTDKSNILDYPAKQFVTFFDNHGLLYPKRWNPLTLHRGRLQWYTVKNGAQEYVKKILADMQADVRLSCGVRRVSRSEDTVVVEDERGDILTYDTIVFASHPNQTLAMLADSSEAEKSILGSFVYTPNDTYMHQDPSYMLTGTSTWPSWTYAEPAEGATELTYNMNRLQSIDQDTPVYVTLNPHKKPHKDNTFYQTVYEHPRFSLDTLDAQEQLHTIQGVHSTWFAGAWTGHGFHEDGLRSALRVVEALHVSPPWEV